MNPNPLGRAENVRPSNPQTALAHGLDFLIGHCRLIGQCAKPGGAREIPERAYGVVVSNVAKFIGGAKFAHRASMGREGYDEAVLDARLAASAASNVSPQPCAQVRACSEVVCPSGQNCLQSNGFSVRAPAQLVSWSGATNRSDEVPHRFWAQAFVDRYYPGGIVFSQDHFWGYERGAFRRLDLGVDIKQQLMALLGNLATDRLVNSLATFMKTYVVKPGDHFDGNSARFICLENGTLDLNTCELVAHSPQHSLQSRLKISWNPDAQCQTFMAFLDQIFVDDADKAEKIRFIRQWIGYLLTPDVSQQLMTWFVGEGSNGKSVLLDVIRALIGEANITAVALSDLSNKFSRAHTAGKTLNICSDLPAKAVSDGYIKAMVAGEAVEARGFDQDSKTFKTTVRFMAAMNTLPKTVDLTDGYFRRIAIVTFNRQFRGNDVNPNLSRELIAELPGILVWAIEGLKDLRRETRFSIPPSSFEAIEQYRTEADPIRDFAEQCLRPSTDRSGYTGTQLRNAFIVWGRDRGIRSDTYNPTAFGRALRRMGYDKRRSGQEIWMVEPLESAIAYFVTAGVTAEEVSGE